MLAVVAADPTSRPTDSRPPWRAVAPPTIWCTAWRAAQIFTQRDITAAPTSAASRRQRLAYHLSGRPGRSAGGVSPHLRSRQQTGEALRRAGVPVTEFRAAVIVGSGSLSFEMIRYLTERLPVMICPRWVFTRAQPIAIRNVLEYLIAALEGPEARSASSRSVAWMCSPTPT